MDLKDFRSSYQQLLSWARCEEDIGAWLDVYWSRLPPFPENQFVEEDFKNGVYLYNGIMFSNISYPCEVELVTEVAASHCIGNTWLFCNDHSAGRPLPERLARCLYLPPDTTPPVFVDRMGDYYLCDDGNHRIYAAFLLGHTVKIRIMREYKQIK